MTVLICFFSTEKLNSTKHPTTPPARTLTLRSHDIHLIILLDKRIRRQRRDLGSLLDVRPSGDQLPLLQPTRVLEQFILKRIIDVLFDDDVLRVTLHSSQSAFAVSLIITLQTSADVCLGSTKLTESHSQGKP